MKNRNPHVSSSTGASAVLLAALSLPLCAQAQTARQYAPASTGPQNWNVAGNWTGGIPDTNAESAIFGTTTAGASQLSSSTTYTVNQDISGLNLGGLSILLTLNTGTTVNLSGGDITFSRSGGNAFTITPGTGNTVSIANNIVLGTGTTTISGVSQATNFSGAFSGSGAVSVTGLTLTNSSNTQSGTWTVGSIGTLTASSNSLGAATYRVSSGANNAILRFSDTGSFTVTNNITDTGGAFTGGGSSGGLRIEGGATATFSDFSLGSVAGNGSVRLARNGSGTATYRITDSDWSPNAHLTLDNSNIDFANNSGVQTINGVLGRLTAGSTLTRSGVGGVTILTKATNLNGTVTVSGGKLLVNNSSAATANATAAVVTTNTSATVTTVSTAGMVVGQSISGTGIPTGTYITSIVDGTTFTLSANATATGAPTATFTANSGTGTGAVFVNSGGLLGGGGLITPGGALGVTVGNGGILSPGGDATGDTVGTLSLNGVNTTGALLTLQSGATLSFELGAGLTSDKINFLNYTGVSDFARNANVIDVKLGVGAIVGTYNFMNFYSDGGSTSIASGFSSGLAVNFLDAGFTGALDYSTFGQVNLIVTAIPEPSAYASFLGLGALAAVALRRRRSQA